MINAPSTSRDRLVVTDSVIPEWRDVHIVAGGVEVPVLSPDLVKADRLGSSRGGLVGAIPRAGRWLLLVLFGRDNIRLLRAQCRAITTPDMHATINAMDPMALLHLRTRYMALQTAWVVEEHRRAQEMGHQAFAAKAAPAEPGPRRSPASAPSPLRRPAAASGAELVYLRPGDRLPGWMGGQVVGAPRDEAGRVITDAAGEAR